MAHGLETYSDDGNLVVRANDKLTRYVDYFVVGENSSGSKSYPQIAGSTIWATGKNLGSIATHKVTFSGTTVYWEKHWVLDSGPTGITVIAVE
jgi:hypothetical protein